MNTFKYYLFNVVLPFVGLVYGIGAVAIIIAGIAAALSWPIWILFLL